MTVFCPCGLNCFNLSSLTSLLSFYIVQSVIVLAFLPFAKAIKAKHRVSSNLKERSAGEHSGLFNCESYFGQLEKPVRNGKKCTRGRSQDRVPIGTVDRSFC